MVESMIYYGQVSERKSDMSNAIEAAIIEQIGEAGGMTCVYRTNVADDEGKTLKGLQKAVGGYVDVIDLRHPVTGAPASMWINDEGKMNGLPINEYATVLAIVSGWPGPAYGDYVAGPVAVTGHDPETGETVALAPEWMDLIAAIA